MSRLRGKKSDSLFLGSLNDVGQIHFENIVHGISKFNINSILVRPFNKTCHVSNQEFFGLWMMLNHSAVKTLAAVGSLFVLVVAIGYGLDKPLYPTGVEPAGHTHAFDGYCNPFFPGETEPWARMMKNIPENVQAHGSGVTLDSERTCRALCRN